MWFASTATTTMNALLPIALMTTLVLMPQPVLAAPLQPAGPGAQPAASFAADIGLRARLGWRLRNLEVRDPSTGFELAVIMANEDRALEFVLAYREDGQTARGYRVHTVPVPRQQRVYPGEREFLELLEQDAPGQLYEECGSYYLEGRQGGVGIDSTSYYVVQDRVSGYGADQALARVLAHSLEDGMALTSVGDTAVSGGHELSLELVGANRRVLHVGTDANHRVILLEVRESPGGTAWQTFRGGRALLATARLGQSVRTLELEPEADGPGRLIGSMLGGHRLEVSLGDFEIAEGEEGCGC
jgi:hypothetical protein